MFLLRSKCASRHAVVVVRSHSGRIPRTNGLQQFDKGQQQTRHNHHPPVRAAESTTWINETGAVLLRGSWRPTDRAPGVDTNGGARGDVCVGLRFLSQKLYESRFCSCQHN